MVLHVEGVAPGVVVIVRESRGGGETTLGGRATMGALRAESLTRVVGVSNAIVGVGADTKLVILFVFSIYGSVCNWLIEGIPTAFEYSLSICVPPAK